MKGGKSWYIQAHSNVPKQLTPPCPPTCVNIKSIQTHCMLI